MNYYIYVSTIIFALFTLMWNTKTLINISIKTILLGLTMTGAVFSLQMLGFIVKA